jgi:hypothetical protein
MIKTNQIKLLEDFRTSNCQYAFSELFKIYDKKIRKLSLKSSIMYNIPENEFRSYLNNRFWIAIKTFESGNGANFNTWFYYNMRQGISRVVRSKLRKVYSLEELTLDSSTDEGDFTEKDKLIALHRTEETVFNIKTKEDQRQLISFLTDPDKVDEITTLIVINFDKFDSITALGKALGIHHETVKRKLRKLARNYDESIFGDYSDYLAV